MLAREFENHSIESRRAPASAYGVNMSLLSNPALGYPMSYGPSNIGYSAGPSPATPSSAFGNVMPPQPIYLPQSYAMNQNVSHVRQASNTPVDLQQHRSLPKPEGKPLDQPQEAYMYYGAPMQPPQPPSVAGEVSFRTDVDTLMRAIQVKSDKRRRGAPVSAGQVPVERNVNNAHGSDLVRDGYSEPTQGFPRSRKRYQCNLPSCGKVFYQKTHLEIHERAHTGSKPFVSCCFSRLALLDMANEPSTTVVQGTIVWSTVLSIRQSQGWRTFEPFNPFGHC